MANVTIEVDKATLSLMKQHYKSYIANRIPKNAQFLVLADTCIITAYPSGKVTFLGKGAAEEAAQWSTGTVITKFNTSNEATKSTETPELQPPQSEVIPSESMKEIVEPEQIVTETISVESVPAQIKILETTEEIKDTNSVNVQKIEEQTQPLKEEQEEIIAEIPVKNEPKQIIENIPHVSTYEPPSTLSSLSLIGSFEVGGADYFGPLTVVAAYVPKEKEAPLKKLGVLEVKGMKDKNILEIAKKVISACEYVAVNVSNEKYNEYIESGTSIGELKARLHNQAIRKLLEKIQPIQPEGVLIDQFVEGDTYFQYLEKEKDVVRENVYFKPKASNAHIATAAASIIATYSYLRSLDKLIEIAGFKLPRGVNLQVDKAAARLLKSYGLEALGSFVKLNFPNTQKARIIARR